MAWYDRRFNSYPTLKEVTAIADFQLQGKSISQPTMLSEMKDNYRGLAKTPTAPPEITVRPPDPEYIFDVSIYNVTGLMSAKPLVFST